ncbi:MAG: hypothetical protein ACO3P0_01525 [Quisquiliibacterium sp.]
MNVSADPHPVHQRSASIRLALDALTPFTRRAIADAVRLAARSGGRIDCVFVEQIALLRAASLPTTRELSLSGLASRPLQASDIEQALHREAQEARRLLAAQAKAAGLSWSFDIVRGALIEEALRHADPQDLLLAAIAGSEPEPAAASRPGHVPAARPLLALVDDATLELPTLRTLLRALLPASVAVWATGPAASQRQDLDAQISALAAELGRPANRLESAPGPDAAALLATLAATLDQLRPQALTMRRDILAGLAAELGWTMRRRPSLLVGIPRPRGH